jgi:hypothetical protein
MTTIQDAAFVQDEVPIRDEIMHQFEVETVTGYTSMIRSAAQSRAAFKGYVLSYDRAGRRTSQQKYDREGKVVGEWKYDAEGRAIEETVFEASGKIDYRYELAYDGAGHWKEKRMYLGSGALHYRIVSERDGKGRIVAATHFDVSDQAIRADAYTYDDRGRLARVTMGHLGYWDYEYDENDSLRRRTGVLAGGSVLGDVSEFEYGDGGLPLRMIHLHEFEMTFECTFFRDASGRDGRGRQGAAGVVKQ